MRNTILAVATILFFAIFSLNAQSLMDEGTRPIRNLNSMYEKTYNYDSTYRPSNTNYSEKSTHQEVLPTSPISDSEIAAIDSAAEAYKWAKIYRLASARTPSYCVESLRAIHGNEKKVQEIAYDRNLPRVIKEKSFLKKITQLFAKKQTKSAEERIANGW